MALGDVIFNAKLNTKPLEKDIKKVEGMKVKSPFGKFREDFTFFSAGFKASAQQMKAAQKEVLGYSKVYEELVSKGKEFKATMESMLGGPTLTQQEEWAKLSEKIQQAKADMEEASNYMKHAERGFKAKNLFGGLFEKAKGLGEKLGATLVNLSKRFLNIGKSARGAGGSISHAMGQGIRRVLGMAGAGAILYKAFQYVKEGMNNLVAYDKTTANSINTLRSALTALKNALASAFAPILNAIAPILAKFINMLTAAANAVASFISALLGKKYVVVAKNVGGISDGISGIGDSANGANKSAKKLQRTLMGFDKINKLDKKDDSSGGSGSPSGGSGGVGGGGFDLLPVGDTANEWADKFRESWENADFYWLGELLANKMNEALAKIPWDKIQDGARRLAKSLATFLNGFIENADWTLVGETIAQALNTAVYFAQTFVHTFNWSALGKAIADTINGFFAKTDWSAIGDTIGTGIVGALTTLNEAVERVDWEKIGKSIVEMLSNIDWVGIFTGAVKLVGNIANAVVELLKGAITEAKDRLVSWIKSGKIWDDLFDMDKVAVNLDFTGNVAGTLDFIANLVGWEKGKGFVDNITGMVAKFTKNIYDAGTDTISGWVSKFTKRNYDAGVDTVKGWTAKFTKKIIDVSAETLSGFTAKITKVKISIAKKLKQIGGFTGIITKWINKAKKKVGLGGNANGGLYKNGKWSPIQKYAEGGMPNGSQLFWARENGPELVGTLGGHTAVMNNDQIVASVSAGVAKAIAGIRFKMSAPPLAVTSRNASSVSGSDDDTNVRQMAILLSQILEAIKSQETDVYLDGEKIKNNVVRRINNHTRATGQLELII